MLQGQVLSWMLSSLGRTWWSFLPYRIWHWCRLFDWKSGTFLCSTNLLDFRNLQVLALFTLNRNKNTCLKESFGVAEAKTCLFELAAKQSLRHFWVVIIFSRAWVGILSIDRVSEVDSFGPVPHRVNRCPGRAHHDIIIEVVSSCPGVFKLHLVDIRIELDALSRYIGTYLLEPIEAPFLLLMLLSKMLEIVYFPASGLFSAYFVKSDFLP